MVIASRLMEDVHEPVAGQPLPVVDNVTVRRRFHIVSDRSSSTSRRLPKKTVAAASGVESVRTDSKTAEEMMDLVAK